jgi:hypothetical protein
MDRTSERTACHRGKKEFGPSLNGGIEGIANLCTVLQCLIDRQRPLEQRALDVLHHEVVGTDIMERTDVWMIQCRNCLRLALESFTELGGGDFNRNVALQA